MKSKKGLLESWEVKVGFVLLVLMVVFGGRAKAQTSCNCDCDITPYQDMTDTVKLDSMFRAEQLTIMTIQKEMVFDDSKDLRSVFDCHALKMEVIYKRLEEVKVKIDRP
jgi:hypothetical protein